MYNVVGAHMFWSTFEAADFNYKGPPSRADLIDRESIMLFRYGVDIGLHMTLPMLFLLSGFVGSLTWRAGDGGMLNFMRKRFTRLLLPYFFGLIFSVFPRGMSFISIYTRALYSTNPFLLPQSFSLSSHTPPDPTHTPRTTYPTTTPYPMPVNQM